MPIPRLTSKKIKIKRFLWPIVITISLLVIIALGLSFYGLEYYRHRFFPHTFIGNLDLSGLTLDEANQLVQDHWNQLAAKGWTFEALDHSTVVYQVAGIAEGSPLLFSLNIEETLRQAWEKQSHDHLTLSAFIANYFTRHYTTASIMINEPLLEQELPANFQPLITLSKPATIIVQADGSYQVKPEIVGEAIDYAAGISEFSQQLQNLKNETIVLSVKEDPPLITQAIVGDLTITINQYLTLAPITLQLSAATWTVKRDTLA